MKYTCIDENGKSVEGIIAEIKDWIDDKRKDKKQKQEQEKQEQLLNTKVRSSKNYDITLPSKLSKLFESAWNYSTYKLPKDMGVNENGEKADPDYEGFNAKIELEDPTAFSFHEKIENGNYVLTNVDGNSYANFAYGQPFNFPLYEKVGRDIIAKWTQALKTAANKITQKLQGKYPGISISVKLTLGPDISDVDCIFIDIIINIPLKCFEDI